MLPFAVFGINSSGLDTAVKLVLLALVVIWLALIYYSYADARRRIVDPMLIGCAAAASLFPYVGTLVYMIVRPPEYLEDVRERELEMQAAEARLHEMGYAHSIEVWNEDESALAGGLYGVALGHVFFGESMFSRVRDASKVALVRLVDEARTRGFELIEVSADDAFRLGV